MDMNGLLLEQRTTGHCRARGGSASAWRVQPGRLEGFARHTAVARDLAQARVLQTPDVGVRRTAEPSRPLGHSVEDGLEVSG
jgi:hypothetical protein